MTSRGGCGSLCKFRAHCIVKEPWRRRAVSSCNPGTFSIRGKNTSCSLGSGSLLFSCCTQVKVSLTGAHATTDYQIRHPYPSSEIYLPRCLLRSFFNRVVLDGEGVICCAAARLATGPAVFVRRMLEAWVNSFAKAAADTPGFPGCLTRLLFDERRTSSIESFTAGV